LNVFLQTRIDLEAGFFGLGHFLLRLIELARRQVEDRQVVVRFA